MVEHNGIELPKMVPQAEASVEESEKCALCQCECNQIASQTKISNGIQSQESQSESQVERKGIDKSTMTDAICALGSQESDSSSDNETSSTEQISESELTLQQTNNTIRDIDDPDEVSCFQNQFLKWTES